MDERQGFEVDLDLLRAFERGLDPRRPERSRVPARILGYGEISTVFEIQAPGLQGLACKRLPLFRTPAEVARYRRAYEEYIRLLSESIGLRLPRHGHAVLLDDSGLPVFYIIQERLPSSSIGSRAIHLLGTDDVCLLVHQVMGELLKVWEFNRRQSRVQVAIDGQISNWSIEGLDAGNPRVPAGASLLYLDTSTPLFHIEGVEQLDPELFLRSAPSFLVWLLRLLYLKGVVNRYYDLRLVTLDLIANFLKEQRPELVPRLVELANAFFARQARQFGLRPITEQEVHAYYREDATIWSLYLAMRKIDRFLRTRLLGRPYPYILPEKIER